jgi:hypothetical protein
MGGAFGCCRHSAGEPCELGARWCELVFPRPGRTFTRGGDARIMAKLLATVWDTADPRCVAGSTQRSGPFHKLRAIDRCAMLGSYDSRQDSGRWKIVRQSTQGQATSLGVVHVTKLMQRKVNSRELPLSLASSSEDEAQYTPMRRHRNLGRHDYVRSHGSGAEHSFYTRTARATSLAICGHSPPRLATHGSQGAAENSLCQAPEAPRTNKEQTSCRRTTEPRRSAFVSAQQRSSR